MHTTDPHYREAAGAIAAMTETYGYTPAVGDRVRCELPFRDTYAIGVVTSVTPAVVVVEVDGETLWYYPHDLAYAGR
jgi:hypothetical protein